MRWVLAAMRQKRTIWNPRKIKFSHQSFISRCNKIRISICLLENVKLCESQKFCYTSKLLSSTGWKFGCFVGFKTFNEDCFNDLGSSSFLQYFSQKLKAQKIWKKFLKSRKQARSFFFHLKQFFNSCYQTTF